MECSICMCDLNDEEVRLQCNHNFHIYCITRWITTPGVSRTCPICRSPINRASINTLINAFTHPLTEQRAASRFRQGIAIGFITDIEYPLVLERAKWVIMSCFLSNWMPRSWVRYYIRRSRRHPFSQTVDAYQQTQLGNARALIVSHGGAPPSRLYICRICRRYVYNEYRSLVTHVSFL